MRDELRFGMLPALIDPSGSGLRPPLRIDLLAGIRNIQTRHPDIAGPNQKLLPLLRKGLALPDLTARSVQSFAQVVYSGTHLARRLRVT